VLVDIARASAIENNDIKRMKPYSS
jgi:hypothetical protein